MQSKVFSPVPKCLNFKLTHTTLLFLAISTISATETIAQTIQGAHVGCISEAAYEEFVDAAVDNNLQKIMAMNGVSCISIEGLQFSVEKRGWLHSQVRVYGNGNSVILWTTSDVIK